jgi:uncharacterized FlgJ-related protein
MIFSLSKKKEFKDPQELAEVLESHLNEIQELVRSARNEKAELHSLIGSVEKERSQIQEERHW